MKKAALILLSLMFFWHAAPSVAAENDWLTGKWELYHDPDGDDKDWVEFSADGKVVCTTADGRSIHGEYAVKGPEINIIYTHKGRSVPQTLTYTPDKTKLHLYSERTQHTSEYRKVK